MSSIEQYLAQIAGARYGEEVRGSIVNAIRENYSNVSTAKTLADDSVTAANAATARANTAAGAAEAVVNRLTIEESLISDDDYELTVSVS